MPIWTLTAAFAGALCAASLAQATCGDVTGDGRKTAADALLVLRASVGHDVALTCACRDCATTTTSTSTTVTLQIACQSDLDCNPGASSRAAAPDSDCMWNVCLPDDPDADPRGCVAGKTAGAVEDIGSPCNDNFACTHGDVCDGAGRCGGSPDDDACNQAPRDDDPDADCRWQVCMPLLSPVPPDANGCIPGAAVGVYEETGSPCNDRAVCTTDDSCTDDGRCEGSPDDTMCNLGPREDEPDADCHWKLCRPYLSPVPPDFNGCILGSSVDVYEQPGSTCNDHNPCTRDDACGEDGKCEGQPLCSPGQICVAGTCTP